MNIAINTDHSPTSDYVFRAADRMRIDGCANAIAREGLSLALYCEHEALLDHYVQLLLTRLRQQAPEHSIEVYFPANTDSLLGRFNEVLAQQSIKQAVKSPVSDQQAQIWIVHDAHNLPDQEMQLLARLIQNFPGANIRAILLMTGPSPGSASLSAFGRKLLRWDIETPNEEQIQAALDLAQDEGRQTAIHHLLRRIHRKNISLHDSPLNDPALLADTSKAGTNASTQPITSQLKTQRNLKQSVGKLKSTVYHKRMGLLVIMGLLSSTLLMLWIQPESFGIGPQKPQPLAAADAAPVELPKTAATQQTSAIASSPLNTSETVAAPAPTTSTPTPQPTQQAPTSLAASQTTPVADTTATTPATAAKPSVTETPEPAVSAQAWIRSLDPNSFLVQHAIATTHENALRTQRKFAGLKSSKIIAAYRPEEKFAHFVVVSGPYAQASQGYEVIKRRDIPSNSWVRPTRSLQDQLKAP